MAKAVKVYKAKAKIVRDGVDEHWIQVGIASLLEDGRIYLTLEAMPIHSDGVIVLYPKEEKTP